MQLILPVRYISWHISKWRCSGGLHLSRLCFSNCRTGFCALGLPLLSFFLGAAEPDAGSLLPYCQAFNASVARPNTSQHQPAFAILVLNRKDCGRPPGESGGKTPRKKRGKGHHLSDCVSRLSSFRLWGFSPNEWLYWQDTKWKS